MCGSAVGTGGGPDGACPEEAAVTGEPSTDVDGAGADELSGGELTATADDEVTAALGNELAKEVGLATWGDADVHAVSPTPAAMTTAAARYLARFTHPVCRFG
jgi:hypothetical protein